MKDKVEVPYETDGKGKVNVFVSILGFTARNTRQKVAVYASLQIN
jgi:hypothetical protein